MNEENIKKQDKFLFMSTDDSKVRVTLSNDIKEFKYFCHYGIHPTPEDFKKLKKEGIIIFNGNDTWYYIIQHNAWTYMNLDLKLMISKTF